jgi:hypothetical protein
MIANGFGPGGNGKEDFDLPRVIIYRLASSPNMAMIAAECMLSRIGRITRSRVSGMEAGLSQAAVSRTCKKAYRQDCRSHLSGISAANKV